MKILKERKLNETKYTYRDIVAMTDNYAVEDKAKSLIRELEKAISFINIKKIVDLSVTSTHGCAELFNNIENLTFMLKSLK